jgi:hypothetical protein
MNVCFYRGPVLGNMGGRSFPRVFERRVKFLFYPKNFWEEFKRHVNEDSPHWLPLGNPEGVRLPGLFERQMKESSGNGASFIN